MTATHDTRPDVAAFVADVRALLGDLTPDEREELLDGLEADLAEQLADGAPDLLADPASYAAELRAAAGLPAARARGWNRPDWSGQELRRELDRLRERWFALVDRNRSVRQGWAIAVALRPSWWALRAWIAVTALDQATGPYEAVSLVPHLVVPGLGVLLVAAAVVISVLIGQGRLWPGSGPDRRLLSRLVLVGLNALAVLLPLTFSTYSYNDGGYSQGYRDAQRYERPAGVNVGGREIHNIYAYDLTGQPLDGVQLVDQDGRPLALVPRQTVTGSGDARTVGCPWFNGTSELFSVFPLQQRVQGRLGCSATDGTGQVGPITVPAPPLAQLSPVTRTAEGATAPSPTAAP